MNGFFYKLVTTAVSLLVLSSCTFHPPSPPSIEERQKQFVHCFREEMNPTDAQIKALSERVFKDDEVLRATGASLRKETEQLEARLETPEAQDPELLDRFHKVESLRSRLSEDHFKRMLLLRFLLTPEQKRKFLVCKRRLGPPALPQE